jgi:N-acetylmuramoyl-L-alanine amidase
MIAICVGHSRKINGRYDGGAYSPTLKSNERDFNLKVAEHLQEMLFLNGAKSHIFDDYKGSGYGSAMVNVSADVKAKKAIIAIELHFNSASESANGHEWLFWQSSLNGQRLAKCFHSAFSKAFPESTNRGLKPITPKDRGGAFLRYTHCPAIITEPFFGSNYRDSLPFATESGAIKLARVYCTAILDYLSK